MTYEKEYTFFKNIAQHFGLPVREVRPSLLLFSHGGRGGLFLLENDVLQERLSYIIDTCPEKKLIYIQNGEGDTNLLFLSLPERTERTLLFLGPFHKKDYIKAYGIMVEFAQLLWNDSFEIERYAFSLKHKHPLVEKVMEEIEKDISANHTLNCMAKKMCVSPGHLSKVFANDMGMTLTEYVNRKKVEYGAYLLTTTEDKICTIAIQCGMRDNNYFSRLFKRYAGISPAEYRKRGSK